MDSSCGEGSKESRKRRKKDGNNIESKTCMEY